MRRGKEIAQGSHASIAFITNRLRRRFFGSELSLSLRPREIEWLETGMAKVCLKVNSEQELLQLHELAQESGLVSHLIRDSGRTEFNGMPTVTACAIGPDDSARIDAITGELTLY